MGYLEDRKESVKGELFALTGKDYPFNVLSDTSGNEIELYVRRNFTSSLEVDDDDQVRFVGYSHNSDEDEYNEDKD